MINVNVVYQNDFIKSIEISGHSGYDVIGRDIVCSAVSTASIVSINAVSALGFQKDINVTLKEDGYLNVEVIKSNETINILLENLINSLEELMKQYKRFVKINKEVKSC